jgi:hypothetical protein
MQRLNTLWQVVNAASSVREITQRSKTFHFAVREPITFYLRAENAIVQVVRWAKPLVEVQTRLQPAFGWRIAADQDDAGVYIAAKRRVVVGGISTARFHVAVPHPTYLVLRLDGGSLLLDNLTGTLHIPPASGDINISLLANGSD